MEALLKKVGMNFKFLFWLVIASITNIIIMDMLFDYAKKSKMSVVFLVALFGIILIKLERRK